MATIYQFHFFAVLSHITHITCWISHEKLVFSNMCLCPGIISFILTSPKIKIQDGHQRPYWKINSKENGPRNKYIITFPINYCTQTSFLASFVYFDRSECQNQNGRHLSFPLFSYLSHSIHCACWMSHQKLVSINICWFYVLLLYIFPQWPPRKVEINNLFQIENQSYRVHSLLNCCHKIDCNDNEWCCKFINLNVYYGFTCQCIIFDWYVSLSRLDTYVNYL